MAYKDKDKQKQANKERQKRYRDWKASGGVTKGVTKGVTTEGVTPTVIPEDDDTLKQPTPPHLKSVDSFTTANSVIDPAVQAIWDGRNAQGQAAGYDDEATEQDYPQTQRPHNRPEPVQEGQTQEIQ